MLALGGRMYRDRQPRSRAAVAPDRPAVNNPSMLRDAVLQAAARDEVRAAVLRVYADLQRAIDLRKPVCTASGRCCRFEEFGHRLYVTTIELAAFVRDLPEDSQSATGDLRSVMQSSPGGCPYQVGGLCSVHAIRPFGCRIFFCDATSDQWQHEQYELFHAELKRLHEALGVPYRYVEWREALRELAGAVMDRSGGAAGGEVAAGALVRKAASGRHEAASAPRGGPRNRLSLPQLPF
jgi:Fe-S-cluster containining protein